MLAHPEFTEVPAPKSRDVQYRIYFYLLAGFAAYAMLESSLLGSLLIVIPAVGVSLILWLQRRANPWSDRGAPRRKSDSRIRLGWSRASNPQYAGRGATLFPHGAFGGGAVYDGYASLPVAVAATLLLLPALLLGAVIGFALWLKHRYERRVETFLLR